MVYSTIGRLLPKSSVNFFKKLLMYADVEQNTERFLGFAVINSFLTALLFSFLSALIFRGISPLFFFIFFIALIPFAIYMLLVFASDNRSKFIESVLPDALQMMSSNLRAGFTTDRALLLSARPEFGPLSKEINTIGKEVTAGKEIDKAMLDSAGRVKSLIYERTISLIISGLKSGGRLSDLLEQTAKDLKDQRNVDKKIRASVGTYVIFMFFAVGFGSPLVLGLVSVLLDVLVKGFSLVSLPQSSNLPLTAIKVNISESFIVTFTVVNLITTAIIGSLVIGLISKGKEREGMRYIPFLIFISLALFFLIRFVSSKFLSSLFASI